jgi:hypothetical protein
MEQYTLKQAAENNLDALKMGLGVLLRDGDKDFAMLYADGDQVAMQFQDGRCPIVFPPMKYQFIKTLPIQEGLAYLALKWK